MDTQQSRSRAEYLSDLDGSEKTATPHYELGTLLCKCALQRR